MELMMNDAVRYGWLVVLGGLVVACGSDQQETPSPDPPPTTSGSTTGAGGNGTGGSNSGGDASSSSSSSGTGGADGEQTAGFVSGSRLRAKFIQGSDGSKHFTGLYDSDKGVDCEFSTYYENNTAADGQRCFPSFSVPRFDVGVTNISTRFVDSNCTQKAPPVTVSCSPNGLPAYLSERTTCYVYGTHQITGTAPGYAFSNGNCYQTGEVYVTTPVPLTDWVEGTEMIE